MNCQQINDLIYDYCDGHVSPEIAVDIEKHLHECPFCRNNEKLTRMENEALYNAGNSPILLPGFTEKLMGSINTEYYNTRWNGFKRLRTYTPTMAAVIVLVVVVAGFIFNNSYSKINNTTTIADSGNQSERIITQKSRQELNTNTESSSSSNKISNVKNEEKQLTGSLNKSIDKKTEDTPVEISHYDSESDSLSKSATNDLVIESPQSPRIVSIQQSSRGAGAENMRLEPVNIPIDFKLTEINHYEQNTTFNYAGSQAKYFKVSISPETTGQTLQADMYSGEAAGISSTLSAAPSPVTSPISWKITNKNQIYIITLTGNLSPEDFQILVSSLAFEEKPGVDN